MADFPQTFTTLEPSGVVGGPLTGAAELIPKGLERRWGGITHDKTDFSPFKGDDSDYDFRKDISGTVYENFPEYFMDVTSQNEADFVRSRVDNLVDYSNLSARSTGFAFAADMLVQGVVDPTNVVAVPLTGGGSIAWNAVKAGAAVALLEGGVQAARLYSDPTVSKTEAGVEVFASGLFGGAFGIGGSLSRKWGGNNPYAGIPSEAVSRIKGQLSEDVNAAETLANIASLNWENIQLLGDKPSRRLGGLTDEELSAQIGSVRSQTDEMIDPDAELGAELRRIERGPEADRFADLRNEAADLESEAILRNLEGKGYTADADLFKLADNWFTDSMLYQSVPTPMKSLLKSSIVPVSVKKFALELAGDNSIGPLAAKMGITSSGSVILVLFLSIPVDGLTFLTKQKPFIALHFSFLTVLSLIFRCVIHGQI